MSGRKKGIKRIGDLWEGLSELIHSFLARAQVKEISVQFVTVIKENPINKQIQVYERKKMNLPQVYDLKEQIITKETTDVHFAQLIFAIFAYPLAFITKNKEEILLLATEVHHRFQLLEKNKPKNLEISRIKKIKIWAKTFSFTKKKVSQNLDLVLKKPFMIKRTSFQQFKNEEIIGFWHILLEKSKIEKEQLELIGIYQPIPLHKVKKIQFDQETGNLKLLGTSEKKPSKMVRILVGKDKRDQKIITVVVPL